MKQIKDNKICFYCMGCNKLLDENFEGIMNCKNFVQGKDMITFYKKLKKVKENGV